MGIIYLAAEKINNEIEFIKNLRALTGYSIADIREAIDNDFPFFAADTNGNEGEENEQLIIKILEFAKKQGDKIVILEENSNEELEEISEEYFMNSVQSRKETHEYFEELDALEEDEEDS